MNAGWAAAGRLAWLMAFSIILTLLAAGIILLVGSQPRGEPIRLLSAPTPLPLVVQVNGEVQTPGVYSLPIGSRVQDAIEAAGGLLSQADVSLLNQAALLQDGQMVWIPAIQPTSVTHSSVRPAKTNAPLEAPATPAPSFPISINTGSVDDLDELPGIGPKLAQRIVDYRLSYGPFATIEDIQAVAGIGPGIFEKIKEFITVEAKP